jgi:hypothetical protein
LAVKLTYKNKFYFLTFLCYNYYNGYNYYKVIILI